MSGAIIESEHTPARKWRVKEIVKFHKDDEHTTLEGIEIFAGEKHIATVKEWELGALIAAAPEMLEALKQLADRLGPRWFLEQNWADPLDAIAKAEGRS